jgi:hypothetical protein
MEKVEAKVSQRGFLVMLGAALVGVSCGSIQSGETSIQEETPSATGLGFRCKT